MESRVQTLVRTRRAPPVIFEARLSTRNARIDSVKPSKRLFPGEERSYGRELLKARTGPGRYSERRLGRLRTD